MEKIIRCYKPGGKVENISAVLPYEELRKRIDGYIETHTMGDVTLVCDEDGKFKQLPFCRNFGGSNFVGRVYVGEFTDAGLQPVSPEQIEAFEHRFMLLS